MIKCNMQPMHDDLQLKKKVLYTITKYKRKKGTIKNLLIKVNAAMILKYIKTY